VASMICYTHGSVIFAMANDPDFYLGEVMRPPLLFLSWGLSIRLNQASQAGGASYINPSSTQIFISSECTFHSTHPY
jgi:hypothetical protein